MKEEEGMSSQESSHDVEVALSLDHLYSQNHSLCSSSEILLDNAGLVSFMLKSEEAWLNICIDIIDGAALQSVDYLII